jgi:hypothetical protein
MGAEATIQDASGNTERHGLSLLDVAKHGVMTIINTLGEDDRLALVNFESGARTVFPLTRMNEAGRALAQQKLAELHANGGTDIWKGLKHGLDALRTGADNGRLGHVMLLTDGASQDRDSILPNVQKYKDTHERLPGTITTFGFGYSLDSELLVTLAEVGSGAYSFIPDAGFVGTVFVNCLSNLLVTMAHEAYLDLEPDLDSGSEIVCDGDFISGGYPLTWATDFIRVNLGTLQYGQSKDIVVPMKIRSTSATFLVANVQYEPQERSLSPKRLAPVEATAANTKDDACDLQLVERHYCRSILADAIPRVVTENSLDAKREVLVRITEQVKASPASEIECVQALVEDMCGQCTEALSKQEYFSKWGVHYLPSIMFAHRLQQCSNFKDPGVQCYGGDLFKGIRDDADDVFNNLPAPKPSVKRQAGQSHVSHPPVSMAAYNNCCGGCIDGASLVNVAGGEQRRLEELQKGDLVLTHGGCAAEVVCLVRTVVPNGRAKLVQLPGTGLRLTPHHPVFVHGKWQLPADIAEPRVVACDAVFSVELRCAPAFLVAGVPCVALAHGIEEGAAAHPYWGTEQVLEDIRKLPGYKVGLVDLHPGSVVRAPTTGLVCGLRA